MTTQPRRFTNDFKNWYLLPIFVLLMAASMLSGGEALSQNSRTSFSVVDTDFSKGRLDSRHPKIITLDDLTKFHGHLCDGVVVGAMAMKVALAKLFPGEPIDRTNIRVVSRSSPCLGDVANYLTGARFQFNTFYVDDEIHGIYLVQRVDNLKTVQVSLKKGVKPAIIDEMGTKAVRGQLSSCEIDALKKHEDDFSKHLLAQSPDKVFEVTGVEDFRWVPVIKTDFLKTDVINKHKPLCTK